MKLSWKHIFFFFLLSFCIVGWWYALPSPLFEVPYSAVLLDREGKVLGASVAEDDQLRFPGIGYLPSKYLVAVLTFEDKRFFRHRGVDGWALLRAFYQNLKSGKIVSGGSTLSMQVIRISRGNPARTYREKLWEILLSFRLEQTYSKWQIWQLYTTHAPFGGNIVGLRAACLKYFNRLPEQLSWAEAAFLAVLPNAPSLKKEAILRSKRNALLADLCEKGYLSEEDCRLACAEPIPRRILPTECIAPHLLGRVDRQQGNRVGASYLDSRLQRQVNEIVKRHTHLLSGNFIYNAAVLVAHIPSGEVRAYVGNSPAIEGSRGNDVDIITSVRSSGSILKPALYALMQQNGYILPGTLVSDVPSRFGGYAPSNFNRSFLGVAPANKALSLSLNIPFVRMLKEYSYTRFYEDLKKLGIHSLNRPAEHYGLSLILGGAETSLWDLCNMYAGMVSVVRHYNEEDGQYFGGEYERLKLWKEAENKHRIKTNFQKAPLGAGAIWLTLKALQEVERPEMESGWKNFVSGLHLSWKTGTSFGFRDAWAVGVNADWVIGVWVGNADGEGRPGLVGVRAAAPILFEVASLLPVESRLYEPVEELAEFTVCKKSGYRASRICEQVDTIKACKAATRTGLCPYHRLVALNTEGTRRINAECESIDRIRMSPWFVLTPVQEWYYVRSHSDYRKLPPYKKGCRPVTEDVMEMIYPQRGTRVFIPRDFGGQKSKVVFELAHRDPSAQVFWHIDKFYIGTTQRIHQMEVDVSEGVHVLTLMDSSGNQLRQTFRVVGNEVVNVKNSGKN